jgi:integrase/recombinase XerD
MTEDMQLKGYSPKTQQAYLYAVERLASHFRKTPASINEEELRAYFLHLIRVEQCVSGTLRIARCDVPQGHHQQRPLRRR